MNIFNNETKGCNVEVLKNNIKVTISEGKKQLVNYWISKIVKSDVFGDIEITGEFSKPKSIGKVITFLDIQDGDYVIQLGKSYAKDKSRRVFFRIENGDIKKLMTKFI